MKDYKFVPMHHSFYDRSGIEAYLEKKAHAGWVLEKVTALGWKFRREQPKSIHYTVCYFPGASPFDPEPSEAELTFREFCSHTGWEIVVSNGQMKVFRNDRANPVPIDTDPLLELKNIHDSAKKSFLPIYYMDLVLGIMQIGLFISRLKISFIGNLSTNFGLYSVLWWPLLMVLCAVELLRYYGWRRSALRAAAENGSFLPTPKTAGFQHAILFISMAALIFMLLSTDEHMMTVLVLATMGGIFAVAALTVCITALMKRWKVSAKNNRRVTLCITIVLSLVLTAGLILWAVSNITSYAFEDTSVGTYEYKGHSFRIYQDEIPIKIEDFLDTDYDQYNYYLEWDDESVLLSRLEASQRPRKDALEQPYFSYAIVDVKWNALYDLCLRDMLDDYEGWYSEDIFGNVFTDSFILTDATPWGAEKAYQLKQGGADEMSQIYILCYPDRLAKIQFGWDVTPQQMAAIGGAVQKLK